MQHGTQGSSFRPTVWPALPQGTAVVPRHVLVMRAGRVHVTGLAPDRPQAVLPPDFALRELLQAPSQPAQVLALMAEWGLLVAPDADGAVGLGAARARLWELQSLGRHVLALRAGDPDAERAAWPAATREATTLEQAREHFTSALDAGLAGLRVHLRPPVEPGATDAGPTDAVPVPTLHAGVALQLAGCLAGSGPVPRCANERCGAPFTVQRSTRRPAGSTPHQAGVRYCDRLCAKAQSERERRARGRHAEAVHPTGVHRL